MTRSVGLVLLVLTLAVGGYLTAQHAKTDGPTSAAAQRAQTEAVVAASGTSFAAAVPTLQAWYAEHGTYFGVTLPPAYEVTVGRADVASYCLEAGGLHENGPNGTPEPGPC
jgi:hypothetical protein